MRLFQILKTKWLYWQNLPDPKNFAGTGLKKKITNMRTIFYLLFFTENYNLPHKTMNVLITNAKSLIL